MCHAGGALRGGTETDVKYFVLIVIGYQCHSCSGLLMTAQIGHAVDVGDLPFLYDLVCG